MKRVAHYYWIINSETPPGRRIRTRYMMSEEDAKARDPTAEPVGEPQWRDIPETEEERQQRAIEMSPWAARIEKR